ncbi:MAG: Glutathione transport system permease protein GsiC [Alphaproteobacteria bacterium MarineAlpha2_Bin1]|nr:MAG: Glutathione transport system permease protein GsiC [Alphaproteobacteria bacterium MarineAlpha2_Bin1]
MTDREEKNNRINVDQDEKEDANLVTASAGDVETIPVAQQTVRTILRRLAELVFLLLFVSTLLFFLLRLTGDPAAILAGETGDQEQLELIRKQYGFDKPLYVQYGVFLMKMLVLDFGTSLANAQDALGLVFERLPTSFTLVLIAFTANLIISIPLGAWLGSRPDRTGRKLGSTGVFILQGIPGYITGLILIQVFSVELRWLPSIGNQGPESWIMPAITLASFQAPQVIRVISANVSEAMREDYIRTARANGAGFNTLLWRHALKNAMLGATALIGAQVSFLIGGSIITEVIFAWPGLGRLLVTSVTTLDFPVVQAAVFVISVFVYLSITATDLAFIFIDPRLRRQRA